MASISQPYIFSWEHIDTASDLERLRLVLDVIPDERLMVKLEADRARGRDDYPIRAVWNTILAGVVFNHSSIASLRRDLQRNAELRKLCGFNPLRGMGAVPTDSAYTHFLESLLTHESEIRAMFHGLVEKLRELLPDLGRHLALDGKALPSFGRPAKKDAPVRLAKNGQKDRRADPDANWGIKTKRGVHEDGTAWEKVTRWFGFELHLLVDSAHELPVNYEVTKASEPETTRLPTIVQDTKERHPKVIAACIDFSADKGYDSTANIVTLYEDYGIRPIIDKRSDWKAGDQTRPVFEGVVDTVVYDVRGTVSCVCPATGQMRKMANWGFDVQRQSLKYRCPAVALGFTCQGRKECPGAEGAYSKVVRIPLEKDRRMFTPVARDSDAWKRAYARRTAVERVNSRIDRVLGFEQHTIRGLEKMEARMGIALVVLLAMALGRIQRGQRDLMRSLVAPAPLARAA